MIIDACILVYVVVLPGIGNGRFIVLLSVSSFLFLFRLHFRFILQLHFPLCGPLYGV